MPNDQFPATPARAGRHHYISRPRISYSCHCCRMRRVKCDKVHPICGRCLKDGVKCTYDQSASPGNSPSTDDRYFSNSKKRKLSHVTTEASSSIRELSSDPSSETNLLGHHEALPGLGYLSRQKGGRSRYVGRTFWAYVDEDDHELENLLQDQDRYSRPDYENWRLQTPYDSYHPVRTRDDIDSPAQSKIQMDRSRLPWQETLSKNRIMSCAVGPSGQCGTSLPKLLEDLPPREACDLLYQSFVVSIHAILPLLYLPTFDEEYKRFWTWIEKRERKGPPTGVLAENPSFLCLLFAVLFGGSVSCPDNDLQSQFTHTSRSAICSKLCEAAMRTQSLVSFPRIPTIYSLTSFLIVQNLLIREEEPLVSCSYISVALRVAQAMGLHRDGSNFGLPPIETEVRRRIWWHIIHTDVMTSISSALPPSCLSDTIYDARMICEFKDTQIDTPPVQESGLCRTGQSLDVQSIYPASMETSTLDVRLMVAVDRYSITSMLRRILRRLFDTLPLTQEDFKCLKDEVDLLNSRINLRINQLHRISVQHKDSESFSTAAEQEKRGDMDKEGFDHCAFVEWAQLLLKLMVHKTYCVLYQPLVRDPSHSMWAQVRISCIDHCQQFMQTFLKMCTSGSFRPYHWLYPGLYQPLHAAVILLSDLLRTPHSSEAAKSLTLIDKLFSLISPHDGVVSEENGVLRERNLSEGGQEAWTLLRRLRRKAWVKMGRDPNIFWTEEYWDTNAAVQTTDPAPDRQSSAEQSSNWGLLQTPSLNIVDAPFDLDPDIPFEPLEDSEYFANSDPSHFNWMEWDAAMMASFDMPGV